MMLCTVFFNLCSDMLLSRRVGFLFKTLGPHSAVKCQHGQAFTGEAYWLTELPSVDAPSATADFFCLIYHSIY
jgi:hypothetical protein